MVVAGIFVGVGGFGEVVAVILVGASDGERTVNEVVVTLVPLVVEFRECGERVRVLKSGTLASGLVSLVEGIMMVEVVNLLLTRMVWSGYVEERWC